MATATWVREELEHQGVAFEERHHAEAYTAQAVAQCEHISGHRVAKVVAVLADGRPVELILPASRRVVLERVRTLLGARDIRLATEDEMERLFPDCERGAVPALRHWPGIEIIMDGSLRVAGNILVPGGTHEDAFCMDFDDWFRLVNPRVEWFSEPIQSRSDGSDDEWRVD